MESLAPRIVSQLRYGRIATMTIYPSRYECHHIVEVLSDKWVEMAPELPGTIEMVGTAIRSFGRFTDDRFGPRAKEVGISDLVRADLDAWERSLLERQRHDQTETGYKWVVLFFALLLRIDEDSPGVLAPEVASRVRQPTRLRRGGRAGPPEYSLWERRRLIRVAKGILTFERELCRTDAGYVAPSRAAIVAAAVLLGLGTGEPPEVLRSITMSSIVAVQFNGADLRTVDELAKAGGPDCYLVRLTKRRAGITYEATYERRARLVHWTLGTLIELTGQARVVTGGDLLWLTARPGSSPTDPVQEVPWTGEWALRSWVKKHVPGGDSNHEPEISEPVTYKRLRKTRVAKEALADPARYLHGGGHHSDETFFNHYSQSPVLRARSGKILIDAITELFDAAVAPTIVAPEAEEVLRSGATSDLFSDIDVIAMLDGDLDGPLAACRAPLDSPHAPKGSPCPSFANGQCFSCRNAIITQRHLPAIIRLTEILDPSRFGDVVAWREIWEPTYRFLTEFVLEQFDEAKVNAAKKVASRVYLDPGLWQTMGSAND